jgi:hypothetical protein
MRHSRDFISASKAARAATYVFANLATPIAESAAWPVVPAILSQHLDRL